MKFSRTAAPNAVWKKDAEWHGWNEVVNRFCFEMLRSSALIPKREPVLEILALSSLDEIEIEMQGSWMMMLHSANTMCPIYQKLNSRSHYWQRERSFIFFTVEALSPLLLCLGDHRACSFHCLPGPRYISLSRSPFMDFLEEYFFGQMSPQDNGPYHCLKSENSNQD